jgi:fructose-bisphosphate aldolase class I
VPIVEPEVLMNGAHSLDRCEEVTRGVLQTVFDELFEAKVMLEGMLLKPNMITAGHDSPKQAAVEEVAEATLRTLLRHVPPAVPGIVFLSGGQSPVLATEHLNAINLHEGPKPWKLSFSYGRALQDEALDAWQGRNENVRAAQRAFHRRVRCDAAAALGRYRSGMETEPDIMQSAA